MLSAPLAREDVWVVSRGVNENPETLDPIRRRNGARSRSRGESACTRCDLQIRTRLNKEAERNDKSVARDDGAMATAEERPIDTTLVHTVDLPPTPQRDRNIPATAWVEAPAELLALGVDIAQPLVAYKRRIGRWLLWRAGPAVKADARYMAIDADDLTRQFTFRLYPDGHGAGRGPDGTTYERFRTWKEALRDST